VNGLLAAPHQRPGTDLGPDFEKGSLVEVVDLGEERGEAPFVGATA
jgi:hypothetical protein